LGTAATTALLYQPRMIGDGDCAEIGGMKIGRGNRSTRRKPAPAPLCPPEPSEQSTQSQTESTQYSTRSLGNSHNSTFVIHSFCYLCNNCILIPELNWLPELVSWLPELVVFRRVCLELLSEG
jgi:hypothetical protein